MYDDAYTRNEDGELAVRVVNVSEGNNSSSYDEVFTRDENGKLCLRVTGGGDAHNKGYFATPQALSEAHPTGEAGDYAIVGSTDTVWIWDEDNSEWIDSDQKGQVESVNGQTGAVNIKSVNNNSLMGSGNIELSTYLTYPSGWTTSGTTKAFCDDIASDTTATVGKAYLGEVTFSDLPASMANGEVIVEIMDGTTSANKVIVLTLTSGNTAPYKWQYTYWNGGTDVSGWVSWATAAQGAKADTAVQPSDLATVATTGSYNDLSNKPIIPNVVQYSTMPIASADNLGDIVQFTGTTNANYTNGYFYKCTSTTEIESGAATVSEYDTGDPSVLPPEPMPTFSFNKTTFDAYLSSRSAPANTGTTVIIAQGNDPLWGDYWLQLYYTTAGGSNSVRSSLFDDNTDATKVNAAFAQLGFTTNFTNTDLTDNAFVQIGLGLPTNTIYAWERVDVQPTPSELPDQTGQSGKFLTTNGTTASWGTVESLPSQTGQSGKFLTTNGTNASWSDNLTKVNTTVTLAVADWSSSTQTVSVTGVTATSVVFVSPDPTSANDYASAGILCTAQGANSLTFTATTTPSVAIDVNIVCL